MAKLALCLALAPVAAGFVAPASSPNAGAIAPQKALAELSFATMHTVASRYTDKIMAQSDRSPRGRGRGHRARVDPPLAVRRGIQIIDVPTRKGSR